MLGKSHNEIKTENMARQEGKKAHFLGCAIFNERYLLFKWKKLSIRIWAESQNQIDIIGKAY